MLLLPVVSFAAAFIALIPPIDAVDLSVRNQVQRVESLLESNDILRNKEEIVANPAVSITNQNKINSSIDYLRSINAMNQLAWLPEEDFHNTDELFGFNEGYEEVNLEDPLDDIERYEISLAEESNYSLPRDNYSYMLKVELQSGESLTKAALIQDQVYTVRLHLEEEFLISLENEEENEGIAFDFTSVLEEFEKEDVHLPVEQLVFMEENGDYTAVILVEYLEGFQGDIVIEFILFL